MISDLTHRLLDLAWEDYRVNVLAEEPRGSTGRGISAAYGEEIGQWQMHFSDFLAGPNFFARKLAQRADRALRMIQHVCRVDAETWDGFFDRLTAAEQRANAEADRARRFTQDEFDFTQFRGAEPFTLNLERLTEATGRPAPRSAEQHRRGARADPARTARRATPSSASSARPTGSTSATAFRPTSPPRTPTRRSSSRARASPCSRIHTFGVAKAYDTKVGTHTFLTQMDDAHPLGAKLKQLEFGTSTGRQRMVGWYDAVEKGDALRYGGFQDLMINKLDALT